MAPQKPNTNLLFIDIETASFYENYEELNERLQKLWAHKAALINKDEDITVNDLYFDKAGIYAEFGKVIVVGLGFFYLQNDELHLKVKTIYHDSEKELLKELKVFIEEREKKRDFALCAHNGKEFDFPYLSRRMLVNGIPLPRSLNLAGRKPWEVNHIDTMELWKFGDRKQYTSLDLLAAIFEVQSSKLEMAGNEVNTVYYKEKNFEKIRRYCLEDVATLAQIYLKMNTLGEIKPENIERIA